MLSVTLQGLTKTSSVTLRLALARSGSIRIPTLACHQRSAEARVEWSRWWESNPHSPTYKDGALPIEPHRRILSNARVRTHRARVHSAPIKNCAITQRDNTPCTTTQRLNTQRANAQRSNAQRSTAQSLASLLGTRSMELFWLDSDRIQFPSFRSEGNQANKKLITFDS